MIHADGGATQSNYTLSRTERQWADEDEEENNTEREKKC